MAGNYLKCDGGDRALYEELSRRPDVALPNLLCSQPKHLRELEKKRPIPASLEMLEEDLAKDDAAALGIRNTFIHSVAPPSPSLEGFYCERKVSTCPSQHVGRLVEAFQQLAPSGSATPCMPTPCNLESPVVYASDFKNIPPPLTFDHGHAAVEPQDLYLPPDYAEYAYALQPDPTLIPEFGATTHITYSGVPYSGYEHLISHAPPAVSASTTRTRLAVSLADALDASSGPTAATYRSTVNVASLPDALSLDVFKAHHASEPLRNPIAHAMTSVPHHGMSAVPNHAFLSMLPPAPNGTAELLGLIPLKLPPVPPLQPAPGSDELPSIGSAGHIERKCKQCAFLYTRGCENGFKCQFCHLCEAGEKKKRQKEKIDRKRAAISYSVDIKKRFPKMRM